MDCGEQHINIKWYGVCIVPLCIVLCSINGERLASTVRRIQFFNKGKQIILAVGDSAAVYFTTE